LALLGGLLDMHLAHKPQTKLELHRGFILKNLKTIFESFQKIDTKNLDVDNYEIY
jgi:hypothetical protein